MNRLFEMGVGVGIKGQSVSQPGQVVFFLTIRASVVIHNSLRGFKGKNVIASRQVISLQQAYYERGI